MLCSTKRHVEVHLTPEGCGLKCFVLPRADFKEMRAAVVHMQTRLVKGGDSMFGVVAFVRIVGAAAGGWRLENS